MSELKFEFLWIEHDFSEHLAVFHVWKVGTGWSLILSLAKKAAEEVLGGKPEEILKSGHKRR
jgi:hypothetical protein